MPERLLPFLGVIVLITLLPGPDTAIVVRNGVRGGARAAWFTGLGCNTGLAVWGLVSVGGLTAILAASGRAFDVVRIAGAVYLALLGLGALRSAATGRGGDNARMSLAAAGAHRPAGQRIGVGASYRQGLVSNLLNPKIALIFLTLIPQFIAPGEPRAATTAKLCLAFILVGTLWYRIFSLGVGTVGRWLARSGVRRSVEAATGTVLVGLAVRVAVNR